MDLANKHLISFLLQLQNFMQHILSLLKYPFIEKLVLLIYTFCIITFFKTVKDKKTGHELNFFNLLKPPAPNHKVTYKLLLLFFISRLTCQDKRTTNSKYIFTYLTSKNFFKSNSVSLQVKTTLKKHQFAKGFQQSVIRMI